MNTPEDEMNFILPKVKMANDKIHHMTGKKINRIVTPEDSPAYLDEQPNTIYPA